MPRPPATEVRAELESEPLDRQAARLLVEARTVGKALHLPGQRERYRALLDGVLELSGRALAVAPAPSVRAIAASAHAARAEDALHGAGQLSLGAQRAPTLEACEDGWQRVEEIVRGAEASARAAEALALELAHEVPGSKPAEKARTAARRAALAARAARRLVDERNHAYTFHTDRRFSFGEGWYLAAASVLTGVAIQIEPGPGAAQAERFLSDAGLGGRVTPYRPRPRAMKHATALVGHAFRADPVAAQQKLRAAFLGDARVAPPVAEWVDRRLVAQRASGEKKVLLWIRDGVHHPSRNTSLAELLELTALVQEAGLVPMWTGDAVPVGCVPKGVVDLILFWKDPLFLQIDMRRAQLDFFEHLRESHGLVGQLGVTTAGMDGPALMGLPTMYLTEASNVRMREWVGAVPGYQEIVRERGYLERVSRELSRWRSATGEP